MTQTLNQKFSGQCVLFGIRGKNILLCLTFHLLRETDGFILFFASAASVSAENGILWYEKRSVTSRSQNSFLLGLLPPIRSRLSYFELIPVL